MLDLHRVPATRLGILVLAAVLAGGGCAAGTAPAGSPPSAAPITVEPATTPATTVAATAPAERLPGSYAACDAAAGSPIRLVVRDQETDGGAGAVIDQLATEFEAGNPGVAIVRQSESPEDLARSIVAELGRDGGPDVAQVPPGPTGLGTAVAAGVVLALDDAATGYGWNDRWAPRTLARLSATDDGARLGEGSLYALPLTGELDVLWFNDDVGHSRSEFPVPRTLAEDLEDMTLVKGEGVPPVLLAGDEDGLLALYETILGSLAAPEWLDAFVYGRDGATFDVPAALAAAEYLATMRDRELLAGGTLDLSRAEAYDAFLADKSQWLVGSSTQWPDLLGTGRTWIAAGLAGETPAGIPLVPGGTGHPFVVRRGSPNAACAVAFLDFLTSDHAMELLAAGGRVLPSHISPGALGTDPSYRDLTFRFRDTEGANRLGHHLAWAFAGADDTFRAELGKLVNGTATPAAFVAAIEAARTAASGTTASD